MSPRKTTSTSSHGSGDLRSRRGRKRGSEIPKDLGARIEAIRNRKVDRDDVAQLVGDLVKVVREFMSRARAAASEASETAAPSEIHLLEPIGEPLDRHAKVLAERVVHEELWFRHVVRAWGDDFATLSAFAPARPEFDLAIRGLLVLLSEWRRSRAVVAAWCDETDHAWPRVLRDELAHGEADFLRAVRESGVQQHTWHYAKQAEGAGLAEWLPGLETVRQTRALLTNGRAIEGSHGPATSIVPGPGVEPGDWGDRKIREELCQLAKANELVDADLAALRERIAAAPGRWAVAHRNAPGGSPIQGLTSVVCLPSGALSATEAERLAEPTRSSDAARLLSDGSARAAGSGTSSRARKGSSETPRAARPLATLDLPLAGARILVFGDDLGMWCALKVQTESGPAITSTERCAALDAGAVGTTANTGAEVGLDIRVGSEIPATVGTIREPERPAVITLDRFRPGPLREALAQGSPNLDRAYAARAWMLPVGESLLRWLFGWGFGEAGARLGAIAWNAGFRRYSEIREDLETVRGLFGTVSPAQAIGDSWLGGIPLEGAGKPGPGMAEWSGCATLREWLVRRAWERLPVNRLGAELNGLLRLRSGALAPVDGDSFQLVHTDTSTSLLAAVLIECVLRERFAASRSALLRTEALVQTDDPETKMLRAADGLFARRYTIPPDPTQSTYERIDRVVERLLTRDATDPVLFVTGGVKWLTAPLLEVARDRRVPCVYLAEGAPPEAEPIAFRWDGWRRSPPADHLSDTAVEASPSVPAPSSRLPRCIVVNVGISLATRFRKEEQKDRNYVPTTVELDAWLDCKIAEGAEVWRLCAELTGIEAWHRRLTDEGATGSKASDPLVVVLIRSRSAIGLACGEAIARLLQYGAVGGRRFACWWEDAWDVADLSAIPTRGVEQTSTLAATVAAPIANCLGALQRESLDPAVLVMGGQRFTAGFMQLIASARGLRVLLAPEAAKGEVPKLWDVPVHAPEASRTTGDILPMQEVSYEEADAEAASRPAETRSRGK